MNIISNFQLPSKTSSFEALSTVEYEMVVLSPSSSLISLESSFIKSCFIYSYNSWFGPSTISKLPLPFSNSLHSGQVGSSFFQSLIHWWQYEWKQVRTLSIYLSKQMQQILSSDSGSAPIRAPFSWPTLSLKLSILSSTISSVRTLCRKFWTVLNFLMNTKSESVQSSFASDY